MSRISALGLLAGLVAGCAMVALGVARWFYGSLARAVLGASETAGGHWDEVALVAAGFALTAASILVLAGRMVSGRVR